MLNKKTTFQRARGNINVKINNNEINRFYQSGSAKVFYPKSSQNFKDELAKKTKLDGFTIKKINSKKYRLYIGSFKTFNSLKSTYISLNKLGFDELRIYKK